MTHRVGSKGQVVIPKHLRERAGLHPGAEVDFEVEGDRVTVVRRPARARRLGGRFRGSRMAESLLEDRAREPR
jgi:AbrB family looped-hinge helix DNA binding protein